jgi:hypothetical protein
MSTKSCSSSSGTSRDNEDDTTYPSVVIEGSLDHLSSDGSMVSLQQERLVIHNETTSTAVQVLIPGVSTTPPKQKGTIVNGTRAADSSVSVGESGVIGRLVTAVSSTTRAAHKSVKNVVTASIQSSSKGANDSRAEVIVAGTDLHSVSGGVAKVMDPHTTSTVAVDEMHCWGQEVVPAIKVIPAIRNDSCGGMESSVNQASLRQG